MPRRMFYPHTKNKVYAILVIFLSIISFLVYIGIIGLSFLKLGFSYVQIILLLLGTLLGSLVNIPIGKVSSVEPHVSYRYTSFFGIPYRIPLLEKKRTYTLIAANVGGCIIPVIISIYLLYQMPSMLVFSIIGVIIVSVVTHVFAKPVKGVGIAVPALIPPFVAAAVSYAFSYFTTLDLVVVAYVSGVLGTLIGADILNLGRISELGAPVASIGGAGTWDGIFFTGIIAALLV